LVHTAEITKHFVTIGKQLRNYYVTVLKNASKGTDMLAGIQLAIPALGVLDIFQDMYILQLLQTMHISLQKKIVHDIIIVHAAAIW
jgi:hypothetical protein